MNRPRPEPSSLKLPSLSKADLRQSLLQTRRSLSVTDWQQKSDRLCAHLHSWLQSQANLSSSPTLLAYWSVRQEPDLSSLFTTLSTYQWGFPRCVGQALSWHRWSATGEYPLQKGAFGILEPSPDAPTLSPEAVDLLLVPAVACDAQGYRLGYGGGFYDRLLSLPEWAHKPTLGIVFEFARLPQLPVDSWDRPLQGVCTEAGLFWVDRERYTG